MPNPERVRRLRKMLEQIAPERGRLESHPRPKPEFALEGARTGIDHAAGALDKLASKRDEHLKDEEVFATEAIVLPKNRPVALIQKGEYAQLGEPWTKLNAPGVRSRLTPLLRSIGRVEVPNDPSLPYGGTGFVVGKDLLMTNRHVARLFAQGLGLTISYNSGDAAVNFKREFGDVPSDQSAMLEVVKVVMIHPYWDMALLRVEGLGEQFPALPLSTANPRDLTDEDVVVIGYPARDDRNDLDLQDRIFERLYNVKRFQPGVARNRETITSFENRVSALTHDSSTLGGNSGSAVIDVKSGHVVGLHFAGVYLEANYAVPTYELARDEKVVRLELNFQGSVAATDAWDPAWRSTPNSEGVPTLEKMRTPLIARDLDSRAGYKPDFLGLKEGDVPVPELTKRGQDIVSLLSGGSEVIKYHKFSIVLHRKRRLALYTAANVDWRAQYRLIQGRKPTRRQLTGLGEHDIEKWTTDPRVDPEHQLPDVFYTKDGGAFDKGHLVRRDDVVWGKTFEDMQKANGDTYHTTNCSPQVKSFNQSAQGDDNWGDLELLVQGQTKSERAILFSGPVLSDDDKVFVGRDDGGGEIRLAIPGRFWKIVVVKQGNDAGAYAFMLEQDLSRVRLVEEFAVPTAWRQYMVAVRDIETAIGGLLDMKWLIEHDRRKSDEGVAIEAALR
jgi:endonuclease G